MALRRAEMSVLLIFAPQRNTNLETFLGVLTLDLDIESLRDENLSFRVFFLSYYFQHTESAYLSARCSKL